MDANPASEAALARQLDGELQLLHQAILLVATGGAPRVVVAGLRLARGLLPEADRLAADAHVRLVPLWTADEQQFDVRVERVTP